MLYVRFQKVRVSRRWRTVLRAAVRAGVVFNVNSGHRTMREQRALYQQNMDPRTGRPRPGRPLTARPNPNAPHIRVGRHAHAIDVDMFHGDGVQALAGWLRKRGARAGFPVPGEGWHLEVPARDLTRLARKLKREERRRRRAARARRSKPRTMSDRGVAMLIREEGFVPYAYNDPAGHATFGVGHLLHRGVVTAQDRDRWGTVEKPKPRSLVESVLREDLAAFERAVLRAVKRPLKQYEFDACVSLAFNIGAAAFSSSTVVRELNRRPRRRRRAADAFLMWDRPTMLRPRRKRERTLFLTGRYH